MRCPLNRRQLLKNVILAGCGALSSTVSLPAVGSVELSRPAKILDAHVHLFDPTRPGGVPWPPRDDSIYRPALPGRYESLARPLGVVGAIAIEASPLPRDNDWLLRTAASSTFIVGIVGDLIPTADNFAAELARLHKDPLFLGIRQGNLWNRSLSEDVRSTRFWPAMQELADTGLVFESANPDLTLLEALLRLIERMPKLTVIIDHLPHMQAPTLLRDQRRLAALITQLGAAPSCFAKLSELPVPVKNGATMASPHAVLDQLWEAFGPEKLLFGSDWPNSDHIAGLGETVAQVRRFLLNKGRDASEKILYSNSQRTYRWRPRQADQQLR